MKNQKRESDGRFQLQLSSKRSYNNFLSRQRERELRQQMHYNEAIAAGKSEKEALDEMWLFA